MRTIFPQRRPRTGDPGAVWADRAMAPLRGRMADVDVAARVMRRIAAAAPAPAAAPLPERWVGVSWAASIAGGVAALSLLMATALALAFSGDSSVHALWTLIATTVRLAAHGYGQAGQFAAALLQAARAVLYAGWRLADAAAPLARGAGLVAALSGLISIGISVVVVSRASRTAPVASLSDRHTANGGLS
jgi:hypothetical protein